MNTVQEICHTRGRCGSKLATPNTGVAIVLEELTHLGVTSIAVD